MDVGYRFVVYLVFGVLGYDTLMLSDQTGDYYLLCLCRLYACGINLGLGISLIYKLGVYLGGLRVQMTLYMVNLELRLDLWDLCMGTLLWQDLVGILRGYCAWVTGFWGENQRKSGLFLRDGIASGRGVHRKMGVRIQESRSNFGVKSGKSRIFEFLGLVQYNWVSRGFEVGCQGYKVKVGVFRSRCSTGKWVHCVQGRHSMRWVTLGESAAGRTWETPSVWC